MDNDYRFDDQTDAGASKVTVLDLSAAGRQFKLKFNCTLKVEIKNNYNYAVKMCIYYVQPKTKTLLDPTADVASGLIDLSITNPLTKIAWYPRHSAHFNKGWNVSKTAYITLLPGEETTLWEKIGWRVYNKDYVDSNPDPYNRFWNKNIVIRIQGQINHDVEKVGVGYSPTQLDIIQTKMYKYCHIGNAQHKRYTDEVTLDVAPLVGGVPRDVNQETSLGG